MDSKRQVAKERTGWRDEKISRRHREYGIALPALDLDFVLVEYQYHNPVALIEYKSFQARKVNPKSGAMRAVSALADNSNIPFFVVRYWASCTAHPWFFQVFPINSTAFQVQPFASVMTELQFVKLLYQLRGKTLPNDIAINLGDILPADVATRLQYSKNDY